MRLHDHPSIPPTPEPTQWWKLIQSAGRAWLDDYAPSMGAALSYYTVFSMAPLLLIVISVAGLVFGVDAARGQIFGELRGLLGDEAAQSIQSILVSVSEPSQGVLGTLIGLVLVLVGATTVFAELQDALDRIWRAPSRPGASGMWAVIRTRLLSFGLILGLAFLLMVSLVFGAVVSALGKWWGGLFGGWEPVLQIVNLVIGFVLTTGVFAMIYKLMPRVQVRWQDVWLGAVVTAALFSVGKWLISVYIGRSGVASGFGAAGSLVVVLVWVYYSAQIFLMGAEFTWVYARTFGSKRGLEQPGQTQPSPPEAVPHRTTGQAPDRHETQAGGAVQAGGPARPPAGATRLAPAPTAEPPTASGGAAGLSVAGVAGVAGTAGTAGTVGGGVGAGVAGLAGVALGFVLGVALPRWLAGRRTSARSQADPQAVAQLRHPDALPRRVSRRPGAR